MARFGQNALEVIHNLKAKVGSAGQTSALRNRLSLERGRLGKLECHVETSSHAPKNNSFTSLSSK